MSEPFGCKCRFTRTASEALPYGDVQLVEECNYHRTAREKAARSTPPEGGDRSARLLLEQVRRDWYTFTGYGQLKADIDHYLDEPTPQGGE